MKKSLFSILGAVALGAASMLPNESKGQMISIGNNWSTSGSRNESITYSASGGDITYTNKQDFMIYDIEGPGMTNSFRAINSISPNMLVTNLMAYKTAVLDGIPTMQRIRFKDINGSPVAYNSFTNHVVTYKVVDKNAIRVFDLGKECALAGEFPFDLPMPITSNAVPGVYATNYLLFTRKDSISPKLESPVLDLDKTNLSLTVTKVLPGENIILESTTNLNDSAYWLPVGTNYLGVTSENFGTTDSITFTNLPAIDK